MAIIPEDFLNAVVALGIVGSDNKEHWIGSGFIVRRKAQQNQNLPTYYLITNKHVVKSVRKVLVRFNSEAGALVKDYLVHLYDENRKPLFSPHPDERTDIIAIQIEPTTLVNDKSIWGAFDLDEHALTLKQMQETGVEEGSLVYALGFPMDLMSPIKAPICRLGCVSRVRDAFLLCKDNREYLVDAQTFPGNSGGPIINRPERLSIVGTPTNVSANLIGILSAYIPYRETLFSRQTGRDRMIQEENSGLTVVFPVDRIKEVVELEWKRIKDLEASRRSVVEKETK